MRDLKPEEICDYACEDVDITLQLKQLFEPEIQKPHLSELFYKMEMPLVKVLKDMEFEGISIDVPALIDYSKELDETLIRLDAEIKDAAGENFNIDSPKQLGEVLFEKLQLKVKNQKKTFYGH
jgi:DNA polymerase-1